MPYSEAAVWKKTKCRQYSASTHLLYYVDSRYPTLVSPSIVRLSLANSKHRGATLGAYTPGSRAFVLQSDARRVLNVNLRPTFEAIRLCHYVHLLSN